MPAVHADNDRLFNIPPRFMLTANGDQFIQYDNKLRRRMIIFVTAESLNNLSSASHWFMDGTFDSVPVQFAPLYTIHGLSLDRNIVGCYGLLPDKRRDTYETFFTQVQIQWTLSISNKMFGPLKFQLEYRMTFLYFELLYLELFSISK